jgi:membrane protease YdiL (CAAX protease family)
MGQRTLVHQTGGRRSGDAAGHVLVFVLLTYSVTWFFFVVAGLLPSASSGLQLPLLLIGSFAPSGVALALTARSQGGPGVRQLLSRLLRWRVGLRWYVFALGFLAAVKLFAAVLYRVANGSWPHFGGEAWYAIVPAIVAAGIFGGPLGEELGWRGYALPGLSERFGPAAASLILGVIWACWHLPLFFLSGLDGYGDQYGQSFPTYLIQVVAFSVALAWLVGNTGGSLLLAVLMHSAINQTKDIVPSRVSGATNMWAFSSSTIAWLTVALLWICAAYFLTSMSAKPSANGVQAPG